MGVLSQYILKDLELKMGVDTFFYDNPENTLYAWMQKHYPAFSAWVQEQENTHQDENVKWRLNSKLINLVLGIGNDLPNETAIRKKLTHSEIADLLQEMLTTYNDALYFRQQDTILKEISWVRPGLHVYNFGYVADAFDGPLNKANIGYLLSAPRSGRIFPDSTDAKNTNNHFIFTGYWSFEECLAIKQALIPLANEDHAISTYYQNQIKNFWIQNDECDHYDFAKEIQEILESSKLILKCLEPLEKGHGVIIDISF